MDGCSSSSPSNFWVHHRPLVHLGGHRPFAPQHLQPSSMGTHSCPSHKDTSSATTSKRYPLHSQRSSAGVSRWPVEAEALDGMHFPKQRFSKGVAYGIFWYGFGDPINSTPPEEQPSKHDVSQPQRNQKQPPRLAPSSIIEMVTFPGIPNEK